jgi:hypothetical protein
MSSVMPNDGNGLGRTLRSSDGGIAEGDNEIDILCDKLAGKGRRAVAATLSPNEQEADGASFFPPAALM